MICSLYFSRYSSRVRFSPASAEAPPEEAPSAAPLFFPEPSSFPEPSFPSLSFPFYPKELENIGFFSVDEIYPNNNFYVDDQGITYTFNEYEVAAYVVGPVHVHLSFDEVSVLLKPDTPVARLAGKS